MTSDGCWWYRFKMQLETEFEEHKREIGYYDNPEVAIRDIDGNDE